MRKYPWTQSGIHLAEKLGYQQRARFVVVGEGDVVVLEAINAPGLSEFKRLLDRAQESAKAAGLTEADVRRAIREVRAKK